MRVGFGVTQLSQGLASGGIDGIGRYTHELLKKFIAMDGIELAPTSYGRLLPPEYGLVQESLKLGRFAPSAAISAFTGLPFAGADKYGTRVNLMHATDHMIPKLGKVPVVATIMDAIPLSHPEWASSRFRWIKNALWRRTAKWAEHIVTISEYSKQEIQTHFGVPAERISVTPLGVDDKWFHPITLDIIKKTAIQYGLPEKYFLFVGTLQPRKNIRRVIDAYRSLPLFVQRDIPLVIVGRAGWQCDDIVEGLISGAYGPSVRWLNQLPDSDLVVVVKSAVALVFPSLHEGFGLPVLEAFAAGTPVITSNGTSLPEVAGDAAIRINPLDASSIAEAMLRVLENTALSNSLREKGLARARLYTWNRTAEMTFDIYKQILNGR